ncbi:MAG: hypothetical protein AAFY57_19820 [Cyanobacteria bacterium J06642_2]
MASLDTPGESATLGAKYPYHLAEAQSLRLVVLRRLRRPVVELVR